MAILWSHTFALDAYTHVDSLPHTFEDVGQLSPPGGATHATVSSIAVMFYKPLTQDTYNMQCRIRGLAGVWSDYSYEDVIWAGETTQIITFTFSDVEAEIAGLDFEIQLSATPGGPAFTTYIARDGTNFLWDDDTYFVVVGDWVGAFPPTKPTNPTPADTGTDIDFSNLTLSWQDGGGADTYDVYVGDAANNLTLLSSTQAGVSFVLSDTQRALFTATGWWRIDATNVNGTTTGDDWSFTVAAPGKAQNPTPTDNQEDIIITGKDQLKKLQWEAPA